MDQEETKKESNEELSELGNIATEIKELGLQLKEVFISAARSDRAKKVQKQVLDSFDLMSSKAEKAIADAKSGKLESDVKRNLYQTLRSINDKLKQYSESIASGDEKADQESAPDEDESSGPQQP